MIESIGPILTCIKDAIINPTLYFVLMFVSALLLFLPKGILKWVKLDELSEKIAPWIGLVFLFAAVIAFIKIITWAFHKIQRRIKTNAGLKRMHDRLWELYPAERDIVFRMYQSSNRSVRLSVSNPSASILHSLKIIEHGSQFFSTYNDNPYYLQPWVCQYLDEHPEYFEEPFEGKRSDKA